MKNIVEICCGSYYDAKQAYLGGADRVELNSSLYLGGISPSLANLIKVKDDFNIKTICMVRNRAGGFFYKQEDIDTMLTDAKIFLENGADGLAFGFLNEDRSVDIENIKRIIEIIKNKGKEAVFHRAFDCTLDPERTIEILIKLGVDRILTSGLRDKAIDGLELIKKLNDNYKDYIEIVVGSGVNYTNAKYIIEKTKVFQVHSSCKAYFQDKTTKGSYVNYSYLNNNLDYDVVSKELVEKLVNVLK